MAAVNWIELTFQIYKLCIIYCTIFMILKLSLNFAKQTQRLEIKNIKMEVYTHIVKASVTDAIFLISFFINVGWYFPDYRKKANGKQEKSEKIIM